MMLFHEGAMDRGINKQLKRFASDLHREFGQVPFERVARRHLDLFRDLRASGATWQMIAGALTNAGVLRRDKSPMSAAQVRSVISRQLAQCGGAAGLDGLPKPTRHPTPARTALPVNTAPSVTAPRDAPKSLRGRSVRRWVSSRPTVRSSSQRQTTERARRRRLTRHRTSSI